MNKKTIWTVVAVIVIAILALWAWSYIASQQSNTLPPPNPPCCKTTTSTTTTSTTVESSTPVTSPVTYVNSQYGFTFSLPADWQGYSIVTSTWTGYVTPQVHGPIISIRNPAWTAAVPTQDIPIMIFTPSQWMAVSTGTNPMPVSAAPIAPSELGANSQYVFALPARYNYAYPADWQEVQTILAGNPLTASN
jgi:hypothetical protein